MAREQRKYDKEYKIQAVKLSKEIGASRATEELGIPVGTLYGWVKAAREGRLDMRRDTHTPESGTSLAEEPANKKSSPKLSFTEKF